MTVPFTITVPFSNNFENADGTFPGVVVYPRPDVYEAASAGEWNPAYGSVTEVSAVMRDLDARLRGTVAFERQLGVYNSGDTFRQLRTEFQLRGSFEGFNGDSSHNWDLSVTTQGLEIHEGPPQQFEVFDVRRFDLNPSLANPISIVGEPNLNTVPTTFDIELSAPQLTFPWPNEVDAGFIVRQLHETNLVISGAVDFNYTTNLIRLRLGQDSVLSRDAVLSAADQFGACGSLASDRALAISALSYVRSPTRGGAILLANSVYRNQQPVQSPLVNPNAEVTEGQLVSNTIEMINVANSLINLTSADPVTRAASIAQGWLGLVEFLCVFAETGLVLLANDPPDEAFTDYLDATDQIYRLNQDLQALADGGQVEFADEINVVSALSTLAISVFGALNAYEKFQGALLAGRSDHASRQLLLANKYIQGASPIADLESTVVSLFGDVALAELRANYDPSAVDAGLTEALAELQTDPTLAASIFARTFDTDESTLQEKIASLQSFDPTTVGPNLVNPFSPGVLTDVASLGFSLSLETLPEIGVIPDVTGLNQSDAVSQLLSAGFILQDTILVPSASPQGEVLGQFPAAGTTQALDSGISLTLSNGPESVTVPNLTGLTEAEARQLVENSGLLLSNVAPISSVAPPASVVGQTPFAGLSVSPGTGVSFLVSTGNAPTEVPDVTGLTEQEASAAIEAAGFLLGNVVSANHIAQPIGRIVSQEPAAGTMLAQGSNIDLVVSLGPPIVLVPGVIGMQRVDAIAAIELAGFIVGTVTLDDQSDGPNETIILQSLTPGDQIEAGTAIDLVVSAGALPIQVPDLIGLSESSAADALETVGLQLGYVGYHPGPADTEGTVLNQTPASTSAMAPSSTISILVSSGESATDGIYPSFVLENSDYFWPQAIADDNAVMGYQHEWFTNDWYAFRWTQTTGFTRISRSPDAVAAQIKESVRGGNALVHETTRPNRANSLWMRSPAGLQTRILLPQPYQYWIVDPTGTRIAGLSCPWQTREDCNPFTWTPRDGLIIIDPPTTISFECNTFTDVTAISSSVVAGVCQSSNGIPWAWSTATGFVIAPVPEDFGGCLIVAVNEEGQIAGNCLVDSNRRVAFLWDIGSDMQIIETEPSDTLYAFKLNNSGAVAGAIYDLNGIEPNRWFLFDEVGELSIIEHSLPLSSIHMLTPQNHVIGSTAPGTSGYSNVYLWHPDTGATEVEAAIIYGTNQLGHVSGSYRGDAGAFVWRPEHGFVSLLGLDNAPGDLLAMLLNDQGTILGLHNFGDQRWVGWNLDFDDDGDGFDNAVDPCPLIASNQHFDLDLDGIGDECDFDVDGDGVINRMDWFPVDASETHDSDADGVGDNGDAFPLDPSEQYDSDNDGVGNNTDVFPFDGSEQIDSDGDGIGDNADLDNDNDGLSDIYEIAIGTNPFLRDSDGDGVDDAQEVLASSDPLDAFDCREVFCVPPSSNVLKILRMIERSPH